MQRALASRLGVKVEKVKMQVGTQEISVSGVIEEVLVGPYRGHT